MSLLLDAQFLTPADELPGPGELRAWAERALAAAGVEDDVRTLGIRVVDNDESRRLNKQFRGIDRPTNVLAFPAETSGWPPDEPLPLGELVVCAPILNVEAGEQSKSLAAHWCHIIVHGTLHLAGHDHGEAGEADAMEDLETSVLATLGFANPYQGHESD